MHNKLNRVGHQILKFWLILAIGLGTSGLAVAVDTPLPAEPSVAERLNSAREAIQNKGWSRALYELREALRVDPRNADVHNLLGFTYRNLDQANLPKAFEHYRLALEINPRHLGAHEYIGEAYLMDKKPLDAQKHLDMLEKICGGRTCEEYQDLARAIARYR